MDKDNICTLCLNFSKFLEGLKPTEFGLYIIKPGSFEPPHKDCTMTGEVREWALNFPVLNCDKGRTVWTREEPNEYEHDSGLYGGRE